MASETQILIDTLRGELREEKEYGEALWASKQDAERILSKKIRELVDVRSELQSLRASIQSEIERLRQPGARAYRVAAAQTPFSVRVAVEINNEHEVIADRLAAILEDGGAS